MIIVFRMIEKWLNKKYLAIENYSDRGIRISVSTIEIYQLSQD